MLTPILFAITLGGTLHPLPPQSPDVPWPTESWPTGEATIADAKALEHALKAVDEFRSDIGETRAILVVQGGRLVIERYAKEFSAETRLVSWSIAKSITHAVAGVAANEGKLKLDDALPEPVWPADDARSKITWRQWLSMTDGLDYSELGRGPVTSDAAKMTFGSGHRDVIAYMRGHAVAHPAGTFWNYSSGGFNIAADGLQRLVAPSAKTPNEKRTAMLAYMKERFFDVIGMRSAQPEFDPQGVFIGGSLVYATAHDFARFGLLYLRDGIWDGKRVLPEGWVDFARTPCSGTNIDTYGAGFWVTAPTGRGYPHASLVQGPWKDTFAAEGRGGQLIVIVPSKDLVVVRLGRLPTDSEWDALGLWVDEIVSAFPDSK